MFGLTYREQRWKAEQQAAELLVVLARCVTDARIEEAKVDASELARLRIENIELRRLLTRYLNETPLGHQPSMIVHEVEDALGAKLCRSKTAV